MKYRFITLVLFTLHLTGCLKMKTESQSSYKIDHGGSAGLSQECDEMNAEGDVLTLLQLIRRDTDNVLALLAEENPEKKAAQVAVLADRISQNSAKVRALAKPEWVDVNYDHELVWTIDDSDFIDLVGPRVGEFKIRGYRVKGVFYLGENRVDLISRLAVVHDASGIQVKYKTGASALELCQLEKTLMVVIEVPYSNFRVKGTRYFNLIVKR